MGRTGGGVFNTVIKSGSNDIHGDVLGYYRPAATTANNFFNNKAGFRLRRRTGKTGRLRSVDQS